MKKKTSIQFFYILLTFSILNPHLGNAQTDDKKGVIDLSDWNAKEVIFLKGEWEYYNKKLYTPNDFKNVITENPIYVSLPDLWNNRYNSGEGFGTYRINLNSLKPGVIYALNINKIQSSYKIWISGILYKEEGKLGIIKKECSPKSSSSEIVFKAKNSVTEIIIQVSNFHHKKGGIEKNISFGLADTVSESTQNTLSFNILLLGVLLIMAAYHFGMFIFRSNDKTNLYFALMLIFAGIFSTTDGELLLSKIFPYLSWEIFIKTNYISNFLRLLFFVLFIYHSFKNEISRLYAKFLTILTIAIIAFILAVPAAIYTHTLIVFLGLTGISLIYLIFGLIKALLNKKPGTIYSLLGILILLLTATNDMLNEFQIIQTISLTTYGIFIFIIFHSYLISIQNAFSYKTIKNLTNTLILQGKVKDALFSAKSYKLDAPLKAISEILDADRSLIFVFEENNWIATNEFLKKEGNIKKMKINVFSGKENIFFSSKTIKKTISEGTPYFTSISDTSYAEDPYLTGNEKVKSIFTYPLIKDGTPQSILYVENYNQKLKSEQFSLEILDSVMPQISVFMGNYRTYNALNKLNQELENKVVEASESIEISSEKLKVLRSEIEKQNKSIEEKRLNLEKQNQEINDGNKYAKKIQTAFLPNENDISKVFNENFVVYKPKQELSGDFYWFKQINDTESIYIAADSTGHGVSGALLAIMGQEILNEIILFNNIKSPKIILNMFQAEFEERMANKLEFGGYNISILYYNSNTKDVLFGGAQQHLYHVKNNNLLEYKGTPVSIESKISGENINKKYFTNHRIKVGTGDMLYLFSDGFIDQIDEENNRKFMKNNFKELVFSLHHENANVQKEKLESAFYNWKGKEDQTDDVLVIGIRI